MTTRARILVAVLGSMACVSSFNSNAADNAASRLSANKHHPPIDVFPSEIYDPLGLVSPGRHGQLVTIAAGFSFTEGPAVDRHGDVFFTDQPNDKIYKW